MLPRRMHIPLPHIKDVIDKMEGSKYWTTLDAASAYWSMLLAESDKEKTAFSVPGKRKYEFSVTHTDYQMRVRHIRE